MSSLDNKLIKLIEERKKSDNLLNNEVEKLGTNRINNFKKISNNINILKNDRINENKNLDKKFKDNQINSNLEREHVKNKLSILNSNIDKLLTSKTQFQLLDDNFKLWKSQRINNYSFNFRWSCYCTKEFIEPVNIIVKNNQIEKVYSLNTKEEIKEINMFKTFDRLFEHVINAINNKAFQINLNYNKQYHYIESNYIDYIEMAIDDERGFNVTNFKIL